MRQYIFPGMLAITICAISAANAQTTSLPTLGFSFTQPANYKSEGNEVQELKNHLVTLGHGRGEVPFACYTKRSQFPAAISITAFPCPRQPLPDYAPKMFHKEFFDDGGAAKLLSEGWFEMDGERAYLFTSESSITLPQNLAQSISIKQCVALIAHDGKLILFMFKSKSDYFSKDVSAFSQVLKSVHWTKKSKEHYSVRQALS